MTVTLQKGQKVDLTKGNKGLAKIMVGLGWDEAPTAKKGLGLFGGGKSKVDIDCDASVLMLDANSKLTNKKNVIYYGNLKSSNGSVKHMGDNLTGAGDGDDEQIWVDVSKVPEDVQRLVFVVNIYNCKSRKQDFGMIRNAFIRIVNSDSNQELLKFNLSDNYSGKTALITGEVYRHNGEWKFAAIGEGTNDESLGEITKRYV
ncbi:MAG: TerD family protein [Bacillota bacterium]|nr:TerD family protein [Bacillota bacterium]